MSGYNTSDQEQIQMLKDWWKKYGPTILTGLLVFFIANFSWSFWRNYQQRYTGEASLLYTRMLSALQQQKSDEVQMFGNYLLKDYKRTPYASLAGLLLAKAAVDQQKLDLALTQLQAVINTSSTATLKQIAKIRAARVLLALHKNPEALDLLRKIDDQSFLAEVLETRGDIWLAQEKKTEAIAAYQDALLHSTEVQSPLLKMKLERLSK